MTLDLFQGPKQVFKNNGESFQSHTEDLKEQ